MAQFEGISSHSIRPQHYPFPPVLSKHPVQHTQRVGHLIHPTEDQPDTNNTT